MSSEPWFVLYKGSMQYKLKPCSREGWLATAALMLVILTPLLVAPLLPPSLLLWGGIAWLAIFPVVFFVFWRFAKSRSRVIDLNAVETDWAEFEAWRKRGKR